MFPSYVIQEFPLHAKLPGGYALTAFRLLLARCKGVGDVNTQLSLLLKNGREKIFTEDGNGINSIHCLQGPMPHCRLLNSCYFLVTPSCCQTRLPRWRNGLTEKAFLHVISTYQQKAACYRLALLVYSQIINPSELAGYAESILEISVYQKTSQMEFADQICLLLWKARLVLSPFIPSKVFWLPPGSPSSCGQWSGLACVQKPINPCRPETLGPAHESAKGMIVNQRTIFTKQGSKPLFMRNFNGQSFPLICTVSPFLSSSQRGISLLCLSLGNTHHNWAGMCFSFSDTIIVGFIFGVVVVEKNDQARWISLKTDLELGSTP